MGSPSMEALGIHMNTPGSRQKVPYSPTLNSTWLRWRQLEGCRRMLPGSPLHASKATLCSQMVAMCMRQNTCRTQNTIRMIVTCSRMALVQQSFPSGLRVRLETILAVLHMVPSKQMTISLLGRPRQWALQETLNRLGAVHGTLIVSSQYSPTTWLLLRTSLG